MFAHNQRAVLPLMSMRMMVLAETLEYIHRLADWRFIRILFTTRMHTFMSAIYCMR